MGKIKIGLLPLYIKLYDDANPSGRDRMVAHMGRVVTMLEQEGLDVMRADVCRVKPEFEAACSAFNEAGVDAVVTLHLAYSPSLESIGALLSLNAPIIVLDTTPDYDLIGRMDTYNGVMPNHGIHGVQDMCNLLKRNACPYELCSGHIDHSDVIAQVASLCRAAAAAHAYRTARVGTAGGWFEGMGDFFISPEDFKRRIGAEVVTLTPETVSALLDQVTEAEVDQELEWDARHFDVRAQDTQNYRAATRSGLALRKWIERESLSALTVNFLTVNACGLPKMPFVELSKAMMRGLGYAGEGDVLTAGLVGALIGVYPETTFTEMFCPDWKHDAVLLSHMGEMNLNLAQWKPVLLDRPFNYNDSGDTASAYGCLKPGDAVLINLAPMPDGFALILTRVELLDVGRPDSAYRDEMQGWMKPCMPVAPFLKAYSEAGGTHHCALVYGADLDELGAFGRMLGFDVVVIR